jgi:hypothetical protein
MTRRWPPARLNSAQDTKILSIGVGKSWIFLSSGTDSRPGIYKSNDLSFHLVGPILNVDGKRCLKLRETKLVPLLE